MAPLAFISFLITLLWLCSEVWGRNQSHTIETI